MKKFYEELLMEINEYDCEDVLNNKSGGDNFIGDDWVL